MKTRKEGYAFSFFLASTIIVKGLEKAWRPRL